MNSFKTYITRVVIPACFWFVNQSYSTAQEVTRHEINIPDISGYITLKCDFHMHTVFSDGLVWPTVRVIEAWRDGLDAISITDHIEYLPHRNDITLNFNRSYDLTLPAANKYGIILIKGAEITRSMPPGHMNALFLKDVSQLDTSDFMLAMKAAIDQGAFVFWNHPCWDVQQPDTIRWFDVHTQLYDNGYMHGIEVINESFYCPQAHTWGVEKNLTLVGNSDIHDPIDIQYRAEVNPRPLTLVFASDKTEAAIKEALFAHRTVVVCNSVLYGDPVYLQPLFHASVKASKLFVYNENKLFFTLTNTSGISYHLRFSESQLPVYPADITIPPNSTVRLEIQKKNLEVPDNQLEIPIEVINAKIQPEKSLITAIKLKI